MANKVILLGRLVRDIEVRKTAADLSTAAFTIACDKKLSKEKRETAQQTADFVNCIAWKGIADYLGRYAKKGMRIYLEGKIQTRSYDGRDGKRNYVTEVVCEDVHILFDKKKVMKNFQPFLR